MNHSYLLNHEYIERVYAGVLGKIIGVYLGRPFEGWSNARIERELGEVDYYVNDRMPPVVDPSLGIERVRPPFIVTDDDITGTFTFLRTLTDQRCDANLTAEQIGQAWLNYIIEKKTILWWGGVGNSTEHTAYQRLKKGVPAPRSGSIALNGKVVAEQIGSQIFIDGWALVAPGDPERAAELAKRAASVSHDGEAIYGAQVLAAMEAQAFVERDLGKLIDVALRFVPRDCVIARLINDMREWREEIADWRQARQLLERDYGYDKYGGNCHMVPNHGVIHLALLYGQDVNPAVNFQRALMIANTAGWDTDCNSGNVGCLLGIRDGLVAIDRGPDWRGPVADRIYLPTADGGRAISDAVIETMHVVNAARGMRGEAAWTPKDGARFHFSLPGSVQGFLPFGEGAALSNDTGRLTIKFETAAGARTATWIPQDALKMPGYELLAAPTLYPGQTVRARVLAAATNTAPVRVNLCAQIYSAGDVLEARRSDVMEIAPGAEAALQWLVPDMSGDPIATIGIEVNSTIAQAGAVHLDFLTWDGAPDVTLRRGSGTLWPRAWVQAVDHFHTFWPNSAPIRILNDDGPGLLMTGTSDWRDYVVRAALTPHMCEDFGLCARVQGLRRYYSLRIARSGKAQLVRTLHDDVVLAEADCACEFGRAYAFELDVRGAQIIGRVGGIELRASDDAFTAGGIALRVSDGRVETEEIKVRSSEFGMQSAA
ncbi:MAG: ADP-ribosylglycohydrolase family protein [Chloroflexi bacterium]|nr:ADP-ribosylglycohydrolase family protein [Chloroflexota bacterium]